MRLDAVAAQGWSDSEVAERWTQLFSKPTLIHRYLGHSELTLLEQEQVLALIATWRSRLQDLSWFMRCLNEPIARMANQEDRCTGRFWEGRYQSQALLEDRALLACMAYVDLNPIRAAMAQTLEESDFTSIQERIHKPNSHHLKPFTETAGEQCLPFALNDYLELADWAGREIKRGKRGFIAATQPPLLQRLNMQSAPVLAYLKHSERVTPVALGSPSRLRSFAQSNTVTS